MAIWLLLPRIRTVKKRRLLYVGIVLLFAGVAGLLVTTAGMIGSYREVPETTSAQDLGRDISGVLFPAVIGGALALIGLVLVLHDCFLSRRLPRA